MLGPEAQRERARVGALDRLLPVLQFGVLAVVATGQEERPLVGKALQRGQHLVDRMRLAADHERDVPHARRGLHASLPSWRPAEPQCFSSTRSSRWTTSRWYAGPSVAGRSSVER